MSGRRFPVALVVAAWLCGCSDWPGVGNSDAGASGGGFRVEDTSGNLGSSCGTVTKCIAPLVCVTQAPGGLCTKNCASDSDCGGGSCQYLPAWGGMICLKTCVSDQMCRSGYACQSSGSAQVCAMDSTARDF